MLFSIMEEYVGKVELRGESSILFRDPSDIMLGGSEFYVWVVVSWVSESQKNSDSSSFSLRRSFG